MAAFFWPYFMRIVGRYRLERSGAVWNSLERYLLLERGLSRRCYVSTRTKHVATPCQVRHKHLATTTPRQPLRLTGRYFDFLSIITILSRNARFSTLFPAGLATHFRF